MTLNKGIVGAIAAGILGFFFATVGFLKTIMIIFLIVLGYLVGTYWETRDTNTEKKEK
jgi:uncharacterized membrane protein